MFVYRLVESAYAHDLRGEGARLYGGRWNHAGTPCVYTSSSRALAVLEFSVNVNLARILRHLAIAVIEFPDDDIRAVSTSELPGDWNHAPAPPSTKDFGNAFLTKADHLVLRLPSTVIPEEFNYLINPRHPRISVCSVFAVTDFVYDVRIKMT